MCLPRHTPARDAVPIPDRPLQHRGWPTPHLLDMSEKGTELRFTPATTPSASDRQPAEVI